MSHMDGYELTQSEEDATRIRLLGLEERIEALRTGQSVIAHCRFGLGIEVVEADDGRALIRVADDVSRGSAEMQWAEEKAVAWLRQIAPHRLAYGADEY